MPSSRHLSYLVVSFGQLVDHNIVDTPITVDHMDIPVPSDDPFFYKEHSHNQSVLPFVRSGKRMTRNGHLSPVSFLSAYIDLSAVYAATKDRADALRTFYGGKLRVSGENNLPINTANLPNELGTPDQFLAGDQRANENPGLMSLHTIWLREHNSLCDTLARKFPDWNDERLYQMARKVNGAAFQRVVYEEYYPAVIGRQMPPYGGYDESVDPTLTSTFSTAGIHLSDSRCRAVAAAMPRSRTLK
jgi:peroxidase